jgi:hypothetical protein
MNTQILSGDGKTAQQLAEERYPDHGVLLAVDIRERKAFIAGHGSRDAEVQELKNGIPDEYWIPTRELFAQIKAKDAEVKKLVEALEVCKDLLLQFGMGNDSFMGKGLEILLKPYQKEEGK